jgi:hypothetical protein
MRSSEGGRSPRVWRAPARRPLVSVVEQCDEQLALETKGAPEALLPRCIEFIKGDETQAPLMRPWPAPPSSAVWSYPSARIRRPETDSGRIRIR